jgi:hypothetical protein
VTQTPDDFDSLAPNAPPPITLDKAELAIYRQIIRGVPSGHFTATDAFAIASYAQILLRLEKAHREVAALSSETAQSSHGEHVHPKVRGLDLLLRRAAQMRSELRLSPASRKRAQLTRLGRERAEAAAGAKAVAAVPSPQRPSHLLFGGARAAAALRQEEDNS